MGRNLASRTFRCSLSFREMDVRQLAALVAIADHGTFSAAARALYTVQSNVSSHIARLEKELGTVLVDRAQGGLTDDGARVVERARRILRELEDISADVAPVDRRRHRRRPPRHARDDRPLAAPRPAPDAVDARHPHVRAIVSEGSTSVLLPALLGGRFNAAVVHLPVDDPELTIEPLFAEDLLLVAPPRHPLAGRGEIPLAELADHRLLLPPSGSALRRVLDRAAASVGVQLHAQAEIDGVRLLASLAVDGHGTAIVPATAVSPRRRRRLRRRSACRSCRRVSSPSPTSAGRRRAPRRGRCSRCCGTSSRPAPTDQPGVRLGTEAFPLSRPI